MLTVLCDENFRKLFKHVRLTLPRPLFNAALKSLFVEHAEIVSQYLFRSYFEDTVTSATHYIRFHIDPRLDERVTSLSPILLLLFATLFYIAFINSTQENNNFDDNNDDDDDDDDDVVYDN
uniref:Uncharacterized protein n=1 Tax=Glossina austeni TaxID=7395 RepID=A0A1A9UT10_GLOAU